MRLRSSWGLVLVAQNAATISVIVDLGNLGDQLLSLYFVGRGLDIPLVGVASGGLFVLFVGFVASILVDL